MESKKVAIIPLDENSKGVSQALANDTSRKILDLISEEPNSAMHIAYKLNLAINTAQYNLERLQAVGLVEVLRVEKSRKGRDMKIYAPTNKIIAIVPKGLDIGGIRAALRGVVPLFLVALLFAVGIDFMTYAPQEMTTYALAPPAALPRQAVFEKDIADAAMLDEGANDSDTFLGGGMNASNASRGLDDSIAAAAPLATPAAEAENVAEEPKAPIEKTEGIITVTSVEDDDLLRHPGIWAFLGGVVVILVLLVMGAIKRKN